MLHRILLINSQVYTKAELLLHDTHSIQLVGPNNIGKSSLINTLNFLYIIDPRQMQFEGNRSLKDSLAHYFPSIHNSYLLFELYNPQKKHYYCLLVKRNAKNELEYYYIPRAYQAHWLFATNAQGEQQILNFSDVLKKLEAIPADDTGILPATPITNKIRYQLLYTRQRETQPTVQLTAATQGQTQSHANPFTKLYKYLIRSTRISSQDLVDALLIAYPPSNPTLEVFADRQSDELSRLLRIDKTITQLQAIESDFYALQTDYKDYQLHRIRQGHTYHTFCKQYAIVAERIKNDQKKIQKNIDQLTQQLTAHQAQLAKSRLALGAAQNEHQHLQKAEKDIQESLDSIAPYQTPLAKDKLQKEIEELNRTYQTLTQWKNQDPNALAKRIAQHTKRIAQLKQQIKHFDHRLIHHIAKDAKVKQQLQTLLSPTLLHAHKKNIKKPITALAAEMRLFDGLIDITSLPTEATPFVTIAELQTQLQTLEKELALAEKLQKDQATYTRTAELLRAQQNLWHQIQQMPQLRKKRKQATQDLANNKKQQHELQAQLAKLQAAITVTQTQYTELVKKKEALVGKTDTYSAWAEALEKQKLTAIPPSTAPAITDLATLHQQLQTHQQQLVKAQEKYQPIFAKLKKALTRYDDNVASFIQDLDQQFHNLPETIKSRDQLQSAIITKLVKPTQHFLKSYEEFKKILHQFGHTLSQHHISGIHQLELNLNEYATTLSQLQAISQLTPHTMLDLSGNREEGLQILEELLTQQRTFSLKDLFGLQLRITLKPNTKPIILDTHRQMQSFGTDKTLRLFIFLQLLEQLLPTDQPNRIAIYIDEVGTLSSTNLHKLLERCKAAHILPIFAATTYVEGLQKYYHLQPSAVGKIQVDSTHIIDHQPQIQPSPATSQPALKS